VTLNCATQQGPEPIRGLLIATEGEGQSGPATPGVVV